MTDLAPSSSVTSSTSSLSSSASSAIPQPNAGSKPWRSNKSLSSKHTATSTSMLSVKQENQASTTTTTTNGASKQAVSVEAPAKAASQKSMLEKLKLFNSKSGSKGGSSSQPVQQTSGDSGGSTLRDSGIVVDRVEAGSNTDLMLEESDGNVRPVNGSSSSSSSYSGAATTTTPVTVAMATSSPKIALKGIAQRTFSRALTAKKSSVKGIDKEREKEKERSAKDKDKERAKESSKRSSIPERGGEARDAEPREENGTGGGSTTTEAEPKRTSKIASLIPKGGKSGVSKKDVSATAHSGIPKPGAKASSGTGAGQGKGTGAPLGGKDGERPRSMRLGGGLALHRDSRHSSSSSSLASTEGKGQQSHGAAPVANAAINTVSVQLPQPQQQYNHPNTATVAPFMYR